MYRTPLTFVNKDFTCLAVVSKLAVVAVAKGPNLQFWSTLMVTAVCPSVTEPPANAEQSHVQIFTVGRKYLCTKRCMCILFMPDQETRGSSLLLT